MYKIGYLDEDEAWRTIFYNYFKNDFDVILFNVKSSSTLQSVYDDIISSQIQLLVIDFRLVDTGLIDFNGDKVVEKLSKNRPYFPIIMLTSHQDEAMNHMHNVNIINDKDIFEEDDEDKIGVLIKKFNHILNNYYNSIELTEKRVSELVEKRNSVLLNVEEEEEFSKCLIYLDEVNPEQTSFPLHTNLNKFKTPLNDILKTVNNTLEELKKK